MKDYFEIDICELCKHNHYYNYLDPVTMEREYDSKCLKGHKRETEVFKCEDFEKDVKTIDYSILEKGFEFHQNHFTGYCFANSVECNEDGDYQFCTKEFKDTAIRLVDFLNMLLRDKNQLEKENRELDNRLNKYIVDYNGLNCEWHWLKTENEQIKKDLKIMLPLILAIDSKMSINECKAVNRLCKLVEDDFIKSKELSKVVEKKEYPKRNPITYESVPEAIYNWDD